MTRRRAWSAVVVVLVFAAVMSVTSDHARGKNQYETYVNAYLDGGMVGCFASLSGDDQSDMLWIDAYIQNPNSVNYVFQNADYLNVNASREVTANVSGTWRCHARFQSWYGLDYSEDSYVQVP